MAQRPVFAARSKRPHVDVFMAEFNWVSGMAVTQKQKNIQAIHAAFNARFPQRRVLEISSKSPETLGKQLSAFSLTLFVPELGRSVPLECVFQGSKVFSGGGPFPQLYEGTAREAKGFPGLKTSGQLKRFSFEGRDFPLVPITAFYNWLYIRALGEHPELAEQLLQYDAFTDIEFTPGKSLNCQAEAAALYVSLARQGLLDKCGDFDIFVTLLK